MPNVMLLPSSENCKAFSDIKSPYYISNTRITSSILYNDARTDMHEVEQYNANI